MMQRTAMDPPISVLVLTPTPTHPPVQGNRQRVFDICRAMQSMGANITLLYYAADGLDAVDAQRMKESWSNLEVVFPRGFVPRHSLARYPAIDDWYDESISVAAQRLASQSRFDVCIANYVWCSKILDVLPRSVVRVIDTHDVFGGRADRFAEIGLAPQWFHTSAAEEGKGLDRADHVLAIQDVEADSLRARTNSEIRTIGFLSAPNYLAPSKGKRGQVLRAGYLGSANPFNVSSILAFGRALRGAQSSGLGFDVHLAGAICDAVSESQHRFVTHGMVNSPAEFYRSVDVVINPMLGGTGLKIKSLEALSFGKPLVATRDAMTGILSHHAGHQLDNVDQVVRRLQILAKSPEDLDAEADISRSVFESYRQEQLTAFSQFWSDIERDVSARRATQASQSRMEPA